MIDIASGEVEDRAPAPDDTGKNAAAVALGRLGGEKGGLARAAKLSAKKRKTGAVVVSGALASATLAVAATASLTQAQAPGAHLASASPMAFLVKLEDPAPSPTASLTSASPRAFLVESAPPSAYLSK